MKTLQLTNINKNNNPSVMGNSEEKIITPLTRLSALTKHKKIESYCNEDYCLSCAYFQQTKGNFGRCTVLKNDKKYDGTKKGKSCKVWRLNSDLINIVTLASIPKLKYENGWIDKLRHTHNNEKKNLREEAREKRNNYFESLKREVPIQFSKKPENFKRGLPYAQTSDISFKRGFYNMKFNSKIISYAIKLMHENQTLSSRQVSHEVYKKFNIKVSHKTMIDWADEFLPDRKWKQRNASHRLEIRNNISQGVKTYFKIQEMMIIPKEVKVKISELFLNDKSLRQISKTVESENKVKLSVKKIYSILKLELKDRICDRKPLYYHTQYHLLILKIKQ